MQELCWVCQNLEKYHFWTQFTLTIVLYFFLVQNSTSLTHNSELESLRRECEVAKKKCKDAQEKYFSESDRLKAIIDEMQGKLHKGPERCVNYIIISFYLPVLLSLVSW